MHSLHEPGSEPRERSGAVSGATASILLKIIRHEARNLLRERFQHAARSTHGDVGQYLVPNKHELWRRYG